MEFSKKIQELRNKNKLTQEQFAEKLYVSRTAVSKWESGKGYPSIDSLKYISKIFNVSIDELLSNEEIIDIAKNENTSNIEKINNLVYGLLDIMSILFIFLPLYGQKIGEKFYTVSLISCTDIGNTIKTIYFITLIFISIIGIVEIVYNFIDDKKIRIIVNIVSLIIQTIAILFFVMTRQPYATSIMFMILIIKMSLIIKDNFNKGTEGADEFRIPDYNITGVFLQPNSVANKSINAGLPNITGYISGDDYKMASIGGAFYYSGTASGQHCETVGGSFNIIQFNASRISTIYGKSATVQPPSKTVQICIRYK